MIRESRMRASPSAPVRARFLLAGVAIAAAACGSPDGGNSGSAGQGGRRCAGHRGRAHSAERLQRGQAFLEVAIQVARLRLATLGLVLQQLDFAADGAHVRLQCVETLRGVMTFIDKDLPKAFSTIEDLQQLSDLADASAEAEKSIGAYVDYLEKEVPPRAKASFRHGKEKF